MRRLLPFLALLALACSASHTGDDVDGGPTPADGGGCPSLMPVCYQGWSGLPDCCLDAPQLATCSGGRWSCPSGWFRAAECGRVDTVCEGIDAGPPPLLYDDCTRTSDCVLVADSCCGTCGQPTSGDVAAVNESRTEDYYYDVACPTARDEPPICPGCAGMANPYLAATCDMTPFRPVCAVVDLATPEYGACTTDADCVLAAPGCCQCGEIDPYSTLAVRSDADLNAVFCDGELPCPPCAPVFDPRASARCDAGSCVVDIAP